MTSYNERIKIPMDNILDEKLPRKYYPRFAATAVLKGFVTADQVKEALNEQLEDNILGRPHRQLGLILLAHNWITAEQIDIVLHEMHYARNKKQR